MKRFKLIFHIVYLFSALIVLYFSIDIFLNTEQYLSMIKLSDYITYPKYIMGIFFIVSLMMLISFLIERYHAFQTKDEVQSLEEQIMSLKAKLYDMMKSDDEKEDDND